MGIFFAYILKSSFSLALFYLLYRLLLNHDTFHRLNRVMLLVLIAISYLLPLANTTILHPNQINNSFMTIEDLLLVQSIGITSNYNTISQPSFTWYEIVVVVYLLGLLFFILRNIWSISQIVRLIKMGIVVENKDGVKVIVHDKELPPFSYIKYILISEKDYDERCTEILIHEKAHISHLHSFDIIFADINIFIQWFNPAAWLIKQELKNIHEYQADEMVLQSGVDAKKYQLLLIEKAVGPKLFAIANNFNHSSLKKRITMMLRKKSNPWARMKYLCVLPVAAIAAIAFARPEISEKLDQFSDVKITDLSPSLKDNIKVPLKARNNKNQTFKERLEGLPDNNSSKRHQKAEDDVFQVVEEMPEFPGGMNKCLEFLAKNVRYPVKAQEKEIEGKVIVQFIVDKDGSIIKPHVVRSVSPELDAEALRVTKLMPKWKPGKQRNVNVAVKYTIPIAFMLQRKVDTVSGTLALKNYRPQENPLYLLDGKKIEYDKIKSIRENSIDIEITKDNSKNEYAQKYGSKAKNGVVLITTKKR